MCPMIRATAAITALLTSPALAQDTVIWGDAAAGLLTAVTNPLYNVFVASFIFLRPPVWRNDDGRFIPFFTTRLKANRGSPLVEHLVQVINSYDPGHFTEGRDG